MEKQIKKDVETAMNGFHSIDPSQRSLMLGQQHYQTPIAEWKEGRKASTKKKKKSARKTFKTTASIDAPMRYRNGELSVDKSTRVSFASTIPPSASVGRWSGKMSGSAMVRGPLGSSSGSLLIAYQAFPSLDMYGSLRVGDPAQAGCGATYRARHTAVTASVLHGPRTPWGTNVSVQHTLDPWTVDIRVQQPQPKTQPDVSVTLSSRTKDPLRIGVGLSKRGPRLDLAFNPKLSDHRRLRLACLWKRHGLQLDAQITESLGSSAGFWIGVRHHEKQGLSWMFSMVRGGVAVRIPISITPRGSVSSLFYILQSTYLSFVSFLVQEAIADLWYPTNGNSLNQAQLEKESRALQKQKVRQDAEQQQKLMSRQAENRRKEETKKEGLVVTKAVYYVQGGDSWDVTIPLLFWTFKSSLELQAASKSYLLGFYNVAADLATTKTTTTNGEESWWSQYRLSSQTKKKATSRPQLLVHYDFRGISYEVVVADEEPLSLPSNTARVR